MFLNSILSTHLFLWKNYCLAQLTTGNKNEGADVATANLVVKTIMVDGGRMLKRMLPAPQGRAYRQRKRSNHVTITVDSKVVK